MSQVTINVSPISQASNTSVISFRFNQNKMPESRYPTSHCRSSWRPLVPAWRLHSPQHLRRALVKLHSFFTTNPFVKSKAFPEPVTAIETTAGRRQAGPQEQASTSSRSRSIFLTAGPSGDNSCRPCAKIRTWQKFVLTLY